MSSDSTRAARDHIRHAARLLDEAISLLANDPSSGDPTHAVEELVRAKRNMSSALGYTVG